MRSTLAYQRWLHGESITVDEATALIASCPRCSECAGDGHHWIEGSIDSDEDVEGVADFQRQHPQAKATESLLLSHFECKHCPAVCSYCVECGTPIDDPEDEDGFGYHEACGIDARERGDDGGEP